MIELRDADSGRVIGEITAAQLQFLQGQMEEDGLDDHNYYINDSELMAFEESGADPELIQLLRANLDANGELEIEWSAA